MISPFHVLKSESSDVNEPDLKTNKDAKYKPPKFSDSFRRHLEEVTGGFAVNDDEGVNCTGEPSMCPSRMVMDNGIDSEYLDDF